MVDELEDLYFALDFRDHVLVLHLLLVDYLYGHLDAG